ncbi:hypothetical protein [Kitasatospora sp. NPDC054795]
MDLPGAGRPHPGRRQYLYHPDFRARQELAKHEPVLTVAAALPALRDRVATDLALRGLQRRRVLACAARLLDLGFFRVGSAAYAKDNGSYGLTTLLRDQVNVQGPTVSFAHRAKSGRQRDVSLTDPTAARAVRALLRRSDTGPQLLACWEHAAGSRSTPGS